MKDNGMKRDCKIPWRWLVFAILVLLLPAQGCGGGNEEEQGEVISVYYINKLETRITAVERVLESSQVEERVEEVLDALAENPVEAKNIKKFPPLRKCWCAPRWCAA